MSLHGANTAKRQLVNVAAHIRVKAASSYATRSSSNAGNTSSPKGYGSGDGHGKPGPRDRLYYKHWLDIQTRWSDNDQYSHVNNAIYYHYFDSVVNQYLITKCSLNPRSTTDPIGLVVSSSCNYFSPIEFPSLLEAGLTIINLGNSSVKYRVGIFEMDNTEAAAYGDFVHCFVDPNTRRKTRIEGKLRKGMQSITVQE